MDFNQWAAEEFGSAELGDLRRVDRLVKIAAMTAAAAENSFSSSMGNEANNKAAHRFFSCRDFDYVDIVVPVVENTITKMARHDRVLLVQDTTHLNYDTRKATLGLGQIGSTDDRSFQGIMMHWTLAVSGGGECLGLAHLKLWGRDQEPRKGKRNAHKHKPIEEKESGKWLECVASLDVDLSPETQLIWVTDREGDIYEVMNFISHRNQDFVIRCKNDRLIDDEEGHIKELVRSAPLAGRQTMRFDRPMNEQIEVEIRFCDLGLLVPRRKINAKSSLTLMPQEIHAVHVVSVQEADPLEWILLTTLPVESLNECLEVIWIYKQRWT